MQFTLVAPRTSVKKLTQPEPHAAVRIVTSAVRGDVCRRRVLHPSRARFLMTNRLHALAAAALVASGLSATLTPASAEVRLPAIFSDHMVLQAEKPAAVWGWAAPGETVVVEFAGQAKQAAAAVDGRWQIVLDPLPPHERPRQLVVRGGNTLTVDDVLVGEVWLCGGQSNMAMQLKGLHGAVDDADAVIAAAEHPLIRMFVHDAPYDIYKLDAPPAEPLADRPGKWIVCSPATAARFTALGYFVGRDLQQALGRPVGLVNSAVGGTPIEAWTSLAAQQADPASKPLLDDWAKRAQGYDSSRALAEFEVAKKAWLQARAAAQKRKQPAPRAPAAFKNTLVSLPGGLFNGMIAPLAPYTVRGVVWYQGERNAAGPFTYEYGRQLRLLVADWRKQWQDPELYFAWVQLPGFLGKQRLPSEPNGWGVGVRDGQRQALDVPHTAMAVTIDLRSEEGHPTNKLDYARRVTPLLLHDVYGRSDVAARGPLYRSLRRDGKTLVVEFDHADGLRAASGELAGFAVAGDDRKFHWAAARVVDGAVVVSSDEVPKPVAVRYGWAANPLGNLVDAAGLPASPFRSDDWK